MSEFVPPNCQVLLLLTTDYLQTVSRPYITFLLHNGFCHGKHANWFLGEVIELLLYTIKSPDFPLSIDQRRLFFITRKIKHLKGVQHTHWNPD